MRKSKLVAKLNATTLVGDDEVRNREVRVSIEGGGVVVGIKTVGEPDTQKQNVTATLSAGEATQLATAILKAAESVRAAANQDSDTNS